MCTYHQKLFLVSLCIDMVTFSLPSDSMLHKVTDTTSECEILSKSFHIFINISVVCSRSTDHPNRTILSQSALQRCQHTRLRNLERGKCYHSVTHCEIISVLNLIYYT